MIKSVIISFPLTIAYSNKNNSILQKYDFHHDLEYFLLLYRHNFPFCNELTVKVKKKPDPFAKQFIDLFVFYNLLKFRKRFYYMTY